MRIRRRIIRGAAAHAAALLRYALVILALVVSLGPAATFYAKLLAGSPAHVCHCEVRGGHASCACPICFPELRSEDDHDAAAIKGVCGEDDPIVRAVSQPAVAPTTLAVAVVESGEGPSLLSPRELLARSNDPPDTRPPRAIS